MQTRQRGCLLPPVEETICLTQGLRRVLTHGFTMRCGRNPSFAMEATCGCAERRSATSRVSCASLIEARSLRRHCTVQSVVTVERTKRCHLLCSVSRRRRLILDRCEVHRKHRTVTSTVHKDRKLSLCGHRINERYEVIRTAREHGRGTAAIWVQRLFKLGERLIHHPLIPREVAVTVHVAKTCITHDHRSGTARLLRPALHHRDLAGQWRPCILGPQRATLRRRYFFGSQYKRESKELDDIRGTTPCGHHLHCTHGSLHDNTVSAVLTRHRPEVERTARRRQLSDLIDGDVVFPSVTIHAVTRAKGNRVPEEGPCAGGQGAHVASNLASKTSINDPAGSRKSYHCPR